tara:strand:- start:661 stop:981 length:321 start_codon:yes stop_codon:yes gene_type:complete
MDLNSIIKDYSNDKKNLIISLSAKNKKSIIEWDKYDNLALNTFFKLWHEHFPNQTQTKSCRSCRKTVTRFFDNVADFISNKILEEEKKKKAIAKKKIKKKADVKAK